MDRTRQDSKSFLALVKDGGESFQQPTSRLELGGDVMEKARRSSKALGWLYASVELGWRFLIRSRSEDSDIMGSSSLESFPATEFIPDDGLGLSKTLHVVEKELAPKLVKTQSPLFMGHMTADIPFPIHIADVLGSFFNQNLVKSETSGAAANIERQTLGWFHRLVYGFDNYHYEKVAKHPDKCLGVAVSGGTIGNITALNVARNFALPESKSLGVYESMKLHGWNKAVIVCSQRAHYSLKKAASLIGLGEHNLIKIPVHENSNKIDIEKLEDKLFELQRDRVLIVALVGVAGSTETGSIDDLNQMARLSGKHKIWFHVDAAWGGAYLFSEKLRQKLAGIEQADSVVVDGHKLLGLTMGHGMTLFKNEHSLESIKHSANYIIRANSFDLGKFSIEGSKPFSSFKLWFFVKTLGLKKIAARIENSHDNAQLFSELMNKHAAFEQTSELETNIVTYRFAPSIIRNFVKADTLLNQSIWLENTLNLINIKLHQEGLTEAPGFVSRTELESCIGCDRSIVVLRAIPINTSTKKHHMKKLLLWQSNRGWELLREAIEKGPYLDLTKLLR